MPCQRLQEEGYEVHIAAPSKKKLRFVVHDFEPGYDTYTEKPGYSWDADLAFADGALMLFSRRNATPPDRFWRSNRLYGGWSLYNGPPARRRSICSTSAATRAPTSSTASRFRARTEASGLALEPVSSPQSASQLGLVACFSPAQIKCR